MACRFWWACETITGMLFDAKAVAYAVSERLPGVEVEVLARSAAGSAFGAW